MRDYSANLVSKDKKYAVLVARFNHFITDRLVEGCLDTLKRHGVKDEEIEILANLPEDFHFFPSLYWKSDFIEL